VSDTVSDRQIRVFVSSTFTDMKADRDYLVKFIFPQLRMLCEERGVTWTEVDLRWGVTDEEKAEGMVLPIVMAEIDRCYPYFIGLLGERYGQQYNDEIPPELAERLPVPGHHSEHSLTELEIVYGVLNSAQLSDHALFYFRDPAYANAIPPKERSAFVSTDQLSREKLTALKERIRQRHRAGRLKYPPRENYANPKALGEQLLADFTDIIKRTYPDRRPPDPLDQEAARQEAYGQSRRSAFTGRGLLLRSLDQRAAHGLKPAVLTGVSGCGKSALLSEWVSRWRKLHPEDLIIQHFIGSTPDSADWRKLVRRILGELKRHFNIPDEVPAEPSALDTALGEWTVKASGSQRVVLVLDGLNQLPDENAARQLGWLPVVFPSNFCVIASSLPGETLDVVRNRNWTIETVGTLDVKERLRLIWRFLGLYRKRLNKQRRRRIAAAEQSANPLFLRTVLDELRQFGEHDRLSDRIDYYLAARDLPDLFDRILTRWDTDFGHDPEYPDLVRRSLCMVACAKYGLLETELLDLLGPKGERLPGRAWAPLYLAAEPALTVRSGLFNFGHDYLSAAVRRRWLTDAGIVREFHASLAYHFSNLSEVTDRKAFELPWQLLQTGDYAHLRSCLLDLGIFSRLYNGDGAYDLMRYWTKLERHGFSRGKEYLAACDDLETQAYSSLLTDLGGFLLESANYTQAEALVRRVIRIEEGGGADDRWKRAKSLNNLAEILKATNRSREAEPLLRQAISLWEAEYDPDVATGLINLAMLLKDTNRLREAEETIRRALDIDKRIFGADHIFIARDLNKLTQVLQLLGRPSEAEPLARRALQIQEQRLGRKHPTVPQSLAHLGDLLQDTGRLLDAEPFYQRALEIARDAYGDDHPRIATLLNNYAQLLQHEGRLPEAERDMRRALAIDEKWSGPMHPDVARDLNNLVALMYDLGRISEVEPLCRRALDIHVRSRGENHPDVATDLNNLAVVLQATGQSAEAESAARRALEILETSDGRDHPNVAGPLNTLALVLSDTNHFEEAERLLRRAVALFLRFSRQNGTVDRRLDVYVRNYLRLMRQMGVPPSTAGPKLRDVFDAEHMAAVLPDVMARLSAKLA